MRERASDEELRLHSPPPQRKEPHARSACVYALLGTRTPQRHPHARAAGPGSCSPAPSRPPRPDDDLARHGAQRAPAPVGARPRPHFSLLAVHPPAECLVAPPLPPLARPPHDRGRQAVERPLCAVPGRHRAAPGARALGRGRLGGRDRDAAPVREQGEWEGAREGVQAPAEGGRAQGRARRRRERPQGDAARLLCRARCVRPIPLLLLPPLSLSLEPSADASPPCR